MSLRFLQAHATHPHPRLAAGLVWAQLAAQGAETLGATLGWCYLTDALAHEAEAVLDELRTRLPGVAWVGAVGAGVLAHGVEYFDEPALSVMVCNLPPEDFRVFHGRQPLSTRAHPWPAHTAQVHADAQSPDLNELIGELADRMATGHVFGGLSTGVEHAPHLAAAPQQAGSEALPMAHRGVWHGGLSGVAFSERVKLVTRITQGCHPVGPTRTITSADRHVVESLDGEPALACLLRDLGVRATVNAPGWQREALPRLRMTLAALTDAEHDLTEHGRHLGADTRVRHILGLDTSRQGVALADEVQPGMQLAFCQRDVASARQDLVRVCAEVREEFDPTEGGHGQMRGVVYVSCAGRGGPHFGAPHAEMAVLAHALGPDVPVVGFFAGGEIARRHIFGYSGVLAAFGD